MIYVLLIVLGLCFGSFVNALTWRLRQQESSKQRKVLGTRLSIAKGRSMCSKCHHELAASDLIPVLSWVSLRGKCRYCHKKIDDNPLVEVVTPILFVVSYLAWPLGFSTQGKMQFVVWLAVLVGFIALTVYDFKWMELPDRVVYVLIALLLLNLAAQLILFGGGLHLLYYAVLSVTVSGGIFHLLFKISDGHWIGGGDVKLGYAIGLLIADPGKSLLVIFVASMLGTIIALPLMFAGKLKRNSHVPFGPMLISAAIFVQLFGTRVLDWYGRVFLGY